MPIERSLTWIGLLANLAGFALMFKSVAAPRTPETASRYAALGKVAFALVLGGFGLQFLAAGIVLPP